VKIIFAAQHYCSQMQPETKDALQKSAGMIRQYSKGKRRKVWTMTVELGEKEKSVEAGIRPTMTDVARLAGVSQSSVSLVLNGMTGARISEATRERVSRAALDLGYALPSQRRVERRPGLRNKIAFIIDEISTSPHPVVSLDGVRDEAWASGLIVTSYVTQSNTGLEQATLETIINDPLVIGIIYATIFTREVVLPELLDRLPLVLLNCYVADKRHTSIVPAEVAGGYNATEYLIKNGHRRIGFINGESWMDAATERMRGYRQALASHDIPFNADLVREGDWLPLKGYQLAKDLLSIDIPPTAILCANDLMALGAIEAAAELSIQVPDEVSIMGYDDQELARYTHPPLSTLVLPNYQMGRHAAELLIDAFTSGRPIRKGVIKVDGPVVERGSVRAL
jgi:LacI family transcriptional regulator